MTEKTELYIDGQLVDISNDTEITLEIKSNFLTDIDQVECNRSWTVKLPKTVHNLAVMGIPDRLGTDSVWKHQYHECEYRKNGVPVVSGARATIDECEDNIVLTMYWGVFEDFQKLKEGDVSLDKLNPDVYLTFNKKNTPDLEETFLERGYGYADYDEYRLKEDSNEWKGWSVSQYEEAQNIYQLVADKKIRTGETLDVAVSGEYETDSNWKCIRLGLAIGSRAQVNGIYGEGNYRAYALLDKDMKVLELAPIPVQTFGGDVEREPKNTLPFADYYYVVRVAERATMKTIRLKIKGASEEAKIEWGVITQSGAATKYGEVTVEAGFDGILEWDAEGKEKPQDSFVYFKQSKANMMYVYRVQDMSGTFGGYKEGFEMGENPQLNINVTIIKDTTTPEKVDYMIEPTYDTRWLVINANMQYSREDVCVKIFGSTRVEIKRNWVHAIQPSVTVEWLMGLIKDKTGVEFVFPESEKNLIKKLALPIIDNKSDEKTWETKNAVGWFANTTQLGMIRTVITQTPDWLDTTNGIKVKQPCTATVEVSCYIDISTDGWRPTGSSSNRGDLYVTSNDYIRMVVKHKGEDGRGEDEDVYIIGASSDASTPDQIINASPDEFFNGKWTRILIGNGVMDFEIGDEMTFELCNDTGTHKGLKLYNGEITMKLKESDEVPYGGNFPIGKNLPDIKVLDFIKFLALITGTFPKQMKGSGKVEMVRYDTLKDRIGEAYDWSERLIAATARNTPRKVKFLIGSWSRHNYFKWKQDSQTRETYDGDLQLDCDILEYSRSVWELPFAASDKNKIPIRTASDGSRYPTRKTGQKDATYQYQSCQPRIMNVVGQTNTEGDIEAALTFNIDLNGIFQEKYETLRSTLRRPNMITEWLYLSNVELMDFDETRPVYLKQYGQYFVVTRLKVQSDGKTEAEMIQLNLIDE